MPKFKLSEDQQLLISLLMGKALVGILSKVSDLDDHQVKEMIVEEELSTDLLLKQMRKIV